MERYLAAPASFKRLSEPSPGSLVIESERRTARMLWVMVAKDEPEMRTGGGAHHRAEPVHPLDAGRFIAVTPPPLRKVCSQRSLLDPGACRTIPASARRRSRKTGCLRGPPHSTRWH